MNVSKILEYSGLVSKIKQLISRYTTDSGFYSMMPASSFVCKSDGNGIKRRHQIIKYMGLSYYTKKINRALVSAAKVVEDIQEIDNQIIEKMVLVNLDSKYLFALYRFLMQAYFMERSLKIR